MIIYKTTNLVNGKIYIGQDSKNNSEYFGSGDLIKSAIKKYGKKNFIKEILCVCNTIDELNSKEKFYISEYNSTDKNIGYNITVGGTNGTMLHRKHTKETKEKMSENMKGPRGPQRRIDKCPHCGSLQVTLRHIKFCKGN